MSLTSKLENVFHRYAAITSPSQFYEIKNLPGMLLEMASVMQEPVHVNDLHQALHESIITMKERHQP